MFLRIQLALDELSQIYGKHRFHYLPALMDTLSTQSYSFSLFSFPPIVLAFIRSAGFFFFFF